MRYGSAESHVIKTGAASRNARHIEFSVYGISRQGIKISALKSSLDHQMVDSSLWHVELGRTWVATTAKAT